MEYKLRGFPSSREARKKIQLKPYRATYFIFELDGVEIIPPGQ